MNTAMDIAKYVRSNKSPYGKMQVMKIVYYSQAWSLVWTGRPLFDEELEAWQNGPVARSVYYRWNDPNECGTSLDDNASQIVDAVFDFYGHFSGSALSEMTHLEQPWLDAREGIPEGATSNEPISTSAMRRFFAKMAVSGVEVPQAPLLRQAPAETDSFSEVVDRQRAKWRTTLDTLALR